MDSKNESVYGPTLEVLEKLETYIKENVGKYRPVGKTRRGTGEESVRASASNTSFYFLKLIEDYKINNTSWRPWRDPRHVGRNLNVRK